MSTRLNTQHLSEEGDNIQKANFSNNDSQQNASADNHQDQSVIDDQEIQNYIEEKKELYNKLMIFLFNSEFDDIDFQNLLCHVNQLQQKEDFEQFIQLITSITNNHHRGDTFINKIFKIIQYYKNRIEQTFSNYEIFNLFQSNKLLLLYLFEIKILTFDDQIYQEIKYKTENNGIRYCHFFYPEIREFNFSDEIERMEEELKSINPNIFSLFDENRHKGKNDSYICSLIQEDSVESFISHVNKLNIPLSSEISHSIFETNSFLNENKSVSLIEYSAFYGSIQIFQYLVMNNVELTPSLWLYAIHSQNSELIHLLEYYKVLPPEKMYQNEKVSGYENCFIESIKCHHNDIANYIENNMLLEKNENVLSCILKYHNFEYFPANLEKENVFFYLCSYKYDTLVNLFMKKKEKSIIEKINNEIYIIVFL